MFSFIVFVVMVVIAFVLFSADSLVSKTLGILLFIIAFNPLSVGLTGKSIPTHIQNVWKFGEKSYYSTVKIGNTINDSIDRSVDITIEKKSK